MTEQALKSLSDSELSQVSAWAQAELAARKEQRKQDAIAKIRELASAVGIAVTIGTKRGRPPKPLGLPGPEKAVRRANRDVIPAVANRKNA